MVVLLLQMFPPTMAKSKCSNTLSEMSYFYADVPSHYGKVKMFEHTVRNVVFLCRCSLPLWQSQNVRTHCHKCRISVQMFPPTMAKSKCSNTLSQMSYFYDSETSRTFGVPNRIFLLQTPRQRSLDPIKHRHTESLPE
jgi:hypothetical protein